MATNKSSGMLIWSTPNFQFIVNTHENFSANFHAAMIYAHYELSATRLKRETINYLKKISTSHPLISKVDKIDENKFIVIGKYLYILNNGGDIPGDIIPTIMPHLHKIIDSAAVVVVKCDELVKDKVVFSIQDRIKDKAHDVAGEIEGWIDDFYMDRTLPAKTVEDFAVLFNTYSIKSAHAKVIAVIFEKQSAEITLALTGSDKELSQGYSNYSKEDLKKFDKFNKNMITACNMMYEIASLTRAPKKIKVNSREKIISKLKYKKEDMTLGLISANPLNIFNCKEVWLYNVKTRKLSQYTSLDAAGITVKGTKLSNYSPASAEKTVKKPAETLAAFKQASKAILRKFMSSLNTVDIPCNGRISEHHIILRIDK